MNHVEKKNRCFTEDYKNCYPFIFSSVYRKMENEEDAIEICQEVFTRFFIKYDEIKNAWTWLAGTARNVIFEYIRKKDRLNDIDKTEEIENLVYYTSQFEKKLILKDAYENKEIFRNDKESILFELVGFYGFTYSEAGEYLNLTDRQVRYRFQLIKKKLEAYFKSKGFKRAEDIL